MQSQLNIQFFMKSGRLSRLPSFGPLNNKQKLITELNLADMKTSGVFMLVVIC